MQSDDLNVSRETFAKLEAFSDLVLKWTPKINLISKQSMQDLWSRHIVDSAQLYDLAPPFKRWVDLGSGGGFPGIVVSILGQDDRIKREFILVESDQRKCAFLRTAIRELNLQARVISDRIEDVPPLAADIVSARALADLSVLLGFAERHLKPGGTALFPKGAKWSTEDEAARTEWSYHCDAITSKTSPDAAVLKIKDIKRV
ncbi:16S rRNA (guanine(527)-N(7))-methyltransferase RsmG [Sulfitobacter sediminilitoris]|nr:16S rRNA (guanine(527)-N(7))-methyltransferase RsmG [Sulfitobacter sediminilitoris]